MGWEQLLSIYQEAKQIQEEDALRDPVACPNDGTILETGPDGQLFCRFDGWRPNQF